MANITNFGPITADGSTTTFNTGSSLSSAAKVEVLVGGSQQQDFTISGTNVILASAPPVGVKIFGRVFDFSGDTSSSTNPLESFIVVAGDETTAITTGTGKVSLRMPYGFTLTAVRGNLVTAQSSGSIFTANVKKNGTTIFSTKITIDNTEKSSLTAATPAVLSTTSLADDDLITVDVDQVGDGTAKGLKVALIGRQSTTSRSVRMKGWAGGGAAADTGGTPTAQGGGGAAFDITVSAAAGTVITAKVGQGGRIGSPTGAGGGGRTSVAWGTNSVVAGAGGGSANGGAPGGAGGTTVGGDGLDLDLDGHGGKGGTQSAGGAGGGTTYVGASGGSLSGGDAQMTSYTYISGVAWPNGGRGTWLDGGSYPKAGGGGDGYYGGGGGGQNSAGHGTGGGGGSSHDTTGLATLYAGSGSTPGNAGDGDRSGAGNGATTSNTAGADGRVVIYVDGVSVATLTYTGADQTYTVL